MTTWTARRLAWSVGIGSIALMLAALVLMFIDRGSDLPDNVGIWSAADVVDVLVNLGVPILGIVIVNKRPRNAIGWIFIVAGAALALAGFGQAYALHVLVADPGTLPAGRALAWLSNVLWPIPIVCLTLLFLLFPTGHLPSPRWRPVVWLVGVIYVLLTGASLILATAGWSDPFEGINVAAGSVGDVARVAIVIAVLGEIVALGLAVASLVVRYRRSVGVERLQLKWFVSAAAVAAVAFSVGFFFDSRRRLGDRLGLAAVPVRRDRDRDGEAQPLRHRRHHQQDDHLRRARGVHHRDLRDRGGRDRCGDRGHGGRLTASRRPSSPWPSSRSGDGRNRSPTGSSTGSARRPTRSCPGSPSTSARPTRARTSSSGWRGSSRRGRAPRRPRSGSGWATRSARPRCGRRTEGWPPRSLSHAVSRPRSRG